MGKRIFFTVMIGLGAFLLIMLNAQPSQAWWMRIDRENAEFTAYAMGGDGAGRPYTGHAVRPGDAAVHYGSNYRPVVAYGTYLYLKYGYTIGIPNGSTGRTDYFSSLVVNDIGAGTSDPYWIDVYFGRWRRSGDACSCPGVSGSYCIVGSTNSCTNAINYGRQRRSYYYYKWVD